MIERKKDLKPRPSCSKNQCCQSERYFFARYSGFQQSESQYLRAWVDFLVWAVSDYENKFTIIETNCVLEGI